MGTGARDDWMASQTRPRVLVGIDGSEDGLRAVRYGARIAQRRGGVLHIVHAVDDAVLAGAWGVVYDPSALQEAGEHATREAAQVALESGLTADQIHDEVLLGNGAAILVRLSQGAELLVVGRRSVSGLERMFIGSTSVAVSEAAHCTEVVISAAATPGLTGNHGMIGVGVDVHEHSLTTLEWAFAEAAARGSSLQVVHVQKPAETLATDGTLANAAAHGIDSLIAPLREKYPAVQVDVQIASGAPVDELLDRTGDLDLLVLGVQKPKLLGVRLGGVMRAVLAHATCPVALVK